MNIFRRIFAAAAFALVAAAAFAIPGVEPLIPDSPGEFVYWRDNSFERESYVGLIRYDEATYGVRYYAPSAKKKPALSFLVLVTIDTAKKGAVEFTGEKVEPLPRSEAETDIINYLHDFIYELFPRRRAAGKVSEAKESGGEMAQFGGRVKFSWDPLVPVLNLRGITTSDGKPALQLVTAGRLRSSDDRSFGSFAGIPKKGEEKKFKLDKSLAKKKVALGGEGEPFSLELDGQWEAKSPMLWMLGESAMATVVQISVPEGAAARLLRMMTLGSERSYPDMQTQTVSRDDSDGSVQIRQTFYDAETNEFQTDRKVIRRASDGTTLIFALTVSSAAYKKNKSYFDGIFKSFKVN